MVTLADPVSPLISFEYTVLLNKSKINNINNKYAKKFLTIHRPEDLILVTNLFADTYQENDSEICSFKKLVNFKIDMIKLSDQEQINRSILFYQNVSSANFTAKHLTAFTKIVNEKNIKNYKPDFRLTYSNNFLKEVNFSLYFNVSQELLTFNKNKAGKNILHSLFFVDLYITDFQCKNLNSEIFTIIDLNHSIDNQSKSEILFYTLKNPNLNNNFKFSILIARECTFKVKLTTRIKVSSNLQNGNSFNFSIKNLDNIDDFIEIETEI